MTPNSKRPLCGAAIFFAAILFTISSCEKPERDIGIDLQPAENVLSAGTVDTFTVVAYTIKDDSIRTDKVNPALFGAYIDPVFGFVKAGHATELRLISNNPVFIPAGSTAEDMVVDSVVLVLAYNYTEAFNTNSSHYGSLGAQYINVFEVTDSIKPDESYFSYEEPRYVPESLVEEGYNMFTPAPSDSVVVNGVKLEPQIRIKLKNSFVDRFFTTPGQSLEASQFVSLLKGIYITTDENQYNLNKSGILYFDTFNQRSRVTMYYRNTQLGDTLSFSFDMRGNTGKYNVFRHQRDMADFPLFDQIENGNRSGGQQDLYLQAMSGTKIRIELPYIQELRKISNISINQATIDLPLRSESGDVLSPPVGVFVLGLDINGNAFLIDDQLEGSAFVDGTFDEENQRYRIKVSRFLQQVLIGTREFYGLEIVTSRAAFSGNRAIVNGPEYPDPVNPEKNLKLAITFTNF